MGRRGEERGALTNDIGTDITHRQIVLHSKILLSRENRPNAHELTQRKTQDNTTHTNQFYNAIDTILQTEPVTYRDNTVNTDMIE